MANRTLNLTDDLYQYVLDKGTTESEAQLALRQYTLELPQANMQIAPEQGQFMAFLVKLMGARKTLEVGVFTGYSTLAVAQALPDDGKIIACDINEQWTQVAKSFWQRAGVADKIDLRLAPANETLEALLNDGRQNQYDFAFIDADKTSYDNYYELCLQLIRPGGMIMIDNVLWNGAVIDPSHTDEDTLAIRQLNEKLVHDKRIDLVLLPLADGLTLARKRD